MGPRYRETCERNLRLHLAPLRDVPLRALTPAVVREWHATALRGKGGRVSIQQAYRFLRAVMSTAVRDGAIVKNPCQIAGAGTDRAKERPVASPAEVVALVEAITPRYRAAVLLAAWCGLRRGEALGLRREDVDLAAGVVTVRRNRVELLETGAAFDADPKTDAGDDLDGCVLDPSVSTHRSDAGVQIEVSMTIDTEDPWEAQAAAFTALRDAFDAAVPAVAGMTRGLVFQEALAS